MSQASKKISDELTRQILEFCYRIVDPKQIVAVCVFGNYVTSPQASKSIVNVLLVVRNLQMKLVNYVKVFAGRIIVIVATDQWVFERDVDRGFLGESLAWCLIFPYMALVNQSYFSKQEAKLKERLTLEMLENLVSDYPELYSELWIRAEYFMYNAIANRFRLFPEITEEKPSYLSGSTAEKKLAQTLKGYREALTHLERQGCVYLMDDYVRITEAFGHRALKPKVRLINISKAIPRALFTSALGIFPRIMNVLLQNVDLWPHFQRPLRNSRVSRELTDPDHYLCLSTANGLVRFGTQMNVETFARKVLLATDEADVQISTLGGMLNDVFLVYVKADRAEKRVVVKRFRNWSSFKWFPLALWSVGTRTFAVLGKSRLEREFAISQTLYAHGIKVPKLLYVNANERMIFREYIKGEELSETIRSMATTADDQRIRKDLTLIERVGKRFAKVHLLDLALGDTKPENILIDEHAEIFFVDLEQASRKGDKVWDIAEFLYYSGHDLPFLVDTRVIEAVTQAFVRGYLQNGGKVETVKKAARPKYTKVFSVFTPPHVMLAISNILRKAESLA